MIEIGTKLKSIRSGRVVEVVELLSGAKKVKLESGEVKVLNDANVARWYDEVVDQKAEQKSVKAVKSSQFKVKKQAVSVEDGENKKPDKEDSHVNFNAPIEHTDLFLLGKKPTKELARLRDEFFKFSKENNIILSPMKRYNKGAIGTHCLFHFFIWNKRMKFEFKPSDLSREDLNLTVKYPAHYRRAYCQRMDVGDAGSLERFFNVVKRIIAKQEKK